MAKSSSGKTRAALKKFTSIFAGKRGKRSPLLMIVILVLFAGIGSKLLFQVFAAGEKTYIAPASSNISLGSTRPVVIHEDSITTEVNAVQADITYDQTKLQYVSTDACTTAFDMCAQADTSTPGIVKIGRAKQNLPGSPTYNKGLTGDQIVATVTFKAIGTGTTSVGFASSSYVITGPGGTPTNVFSMQSSMPGSYTISDTSAPTVPGGLTAGTRTVTSVAFSWPSSTDNVLVTGYKVYRNGTLINGNVATTNFTDTGRTPNTSYSYTVSAFDAAGNNSAVSASLVISTLPDTTAPTTPTALTVGTRTVNSIAMSWTASTDNVAVTGYKIFRGGTQVGTSTSTSFTGTGLTPNTAYSYTVSSYDAAGNNSAQTTALATSTLPDTSAPTVPTGLSSSSQTTNTIVLNWATSTDNLAVTGYKIYRAGTQIGTSATNTYINTGLTKASSYSYTVSSYDAAGNNSVASTALVISTKAKPGDVNSDGYVDGGDFSPLAYNYGKCGKTLADGDLTMAPAPIPPDPGCVNVWDLQVLATYWGT